MALERATADPNSLVASSSREQVGTGAGDGLPPGSKIEVNENSWAPDGVGGGIIEATVSSPGRPSTTFVVVMVSESGQWKVVASMPVEGGPIG
ncbi:hypothetical protein DMH04_02050 [Kibdelosporangium aridum]|uniref:Uncharacterized protein n=2 Tax=Kibdelosporangium aridum TaxID=2030 RepID=A0A428ZUM6_KIBAR|nr:hypothetical protein DMH04_02050 [Kibdelosporangium aridum]